MQGISNVTLPANALVVLKVYTVLGEKIATLLNGQFGPGKQSVTFNSNGLSPGIYFYAITAGDFTETKKMVAVE